MAKYFLAIVSLLGLLGCAGCANREAPPRTSQRVSVEPRRQTGESSEVQEPERTQAEPTDLEPEEAALRSAPIAEDDVPPVETDGAKAAEVGPETSVESVGSIEDTVAAEVNEPATVTPSEPEQTSAIAPDRIEAAEPNDGQVTEPNDAPPASTEPNDTTAAAHEGAASYSFPEGYADILEAYVQDDGWVDYGSLRRRRLELKPLLMELDELDPNLYRRWSRDEKLAFWINAYNLKMLEIITRNYPIESSWWLRLTWPPSDIRHIKGIWTDYKFIVMDEEFTLAEVERRFFHETFQDPRVYLALTYTSRSSPPLRREPYGRDALDEQLDRQVKKFLAGDLGLRIDRSNMVVHLSALFKPTWHGKEFVARYGTDKKFKGRDAETRATLNFITNYLSRDDVYFLEVENYTIAYINFDWRLNDRSGGN